MRGLKTAIRILAKGSLLVSGYFSDWVVGYGLYGVVMYALYHYTHTDTVHSMLIALIVGTPVSAVWTLYFIRLYDRAGGFRVQDPKKIEETAQANRAKGWRKGLSLVLASLRKALLFVLASLKGGPSATLAALRQGGENRRGLSRVDRFVRLPTCVIIANILWTLRAGGIVAGPALLLHLLDMLPSYFYQFFIFRML